MSITSFITELSDINQMENVFNTPRDIDKDSLYFSELSKTYGEIKKIANKHSLSKISDEIENIEEAIKQYYDGQIDSALKIIRNIIREFKDVPYICTAFNHCGAFNNLATEKVADKDIDLYRARKGTAEQIEDIWSMYHIPFNMRSSVGSQRFSIPGLPCLYLGKSVYTCWMELKQPSDSEFYVSRARVDDNIKIFNLAVNINDLINLCSNLPEKDSVEYNSSQKGVTRDEFIFNYVKVWVLSFACSFKIKQESRQFKSDYIIPQLVMLALKQLNIPAVAYLGKTFSENEIYRNFANLNLNVAIIMDGKDIFINPKDDSKYSNLMKNVHLSSPVNFAQFKNIINSYPSGLYKSDNETGSPRGIVDHYIEIAGISKSYSDTWFCKFEQHLVNLDLKNC